MSGFFTAIKRVFGRGTPESAPTQAIAPSTPAASSSEALPARPTANPEATSVSQAAPTGAPETPEASAPSVTHEDAAEAEEMAATPVADSAAEMFEPPMDAGAAPTGGETVVIAVETVAVAETEPSSDEEAGAPLAAPSASVPDTMDASSAEQTDVAIVTETVVVFEDAPSAAPDASDAPNLAGEPAGDETTATEPSRDPAAEERQEPAQEPAQEA